MEDGREGAASRSGRRRGEAHAQGPLWAARQAAGREVEHLCLGGGHRRLQELELPALPETAPGLEGGGWGEGSRPEKGRPPANNTELEQGQAFPVLAIPSSPCLQRPVASMALGSSGGGVTEEPPLVSGPDLPRSPS